MRPVLNLKSFLAVLLILILPGSFLVAYFRNYSPGAGGHVHGEIGKEGGAAVSRAGGPDAAHSGGEAHGAMGHDTLPKPSDGQTQPPAGQPQKQHEERGIGQGTAQPSTMRSQPRPEQALSQVWAASAEERLSLSLPGAWPGVPGASHLYHIGATDFYLDDPQYIALTIEQRAALETIRERWLLAGSTAERSMERAEQELWMLTAVDQPDAPQIEAKIREIESLRCDGRLLFIQAVGDASRLLTDEQRKGLTGFAPPGPPGGMAGPSTSTAVGGMKDR